MFQKLNYGWRIFATGFSFFIFGLGCLILGGVFIPLISTFSSTPELERRRIRSLISLCFTAFFAMMHHLGLFDYRISGHEIMKQDRGCLVIANHPSLIDVISLISLYPNACCIVKKELWSNFFTKRIVAGAGYIANDEPEKLLTDCAESLARGDVLIIFPEGTRTVPGKEMTLQRGAAHIALRLKCPIRTIQICVNPSTLTKNLPWYRVPARKSDFFVSAKELLSIQEYIQQDVPFSLAARRLTAKMRDNIEVALSPNY